VRLNSLNATRPGRGGTAALTALAVAALFGHASAIRAQSLPDAAAAPIATVSAPADVTPATPDALVALRYLPAKPDEASAPPTEIADADSTPLAAEPALPDNDGAMASDDALDDQTLSHQRGGAVGMLMVAATPQLMRGGNAVTLWDEIAPPAPLPIPVDSSQAAQGNIANYTRK
jgi:hypothetical protein